MKKQFQSESGMTLVEILAALVLLSIVLLSFFSFFTQSTKFTQHNKAKLTNVDVAEEIVAVVRNWGFKENWGCSGSWDSVEYKEPFKGLVDKENWKCKNTSLLVNEEYGKHNVEIAIGDGPANTLLKKAKITVTSRSVNGIKESPFITEMYFDDEMEAP